MNDGWRGGWDGMKSGSDSGGAKPQGYPLLVFVREDVLCRLHYYIGFAKCMMLLNLFLKNIY